MWHPSLTRTSMTRAALAAALTFALFTPPAFPSAGRQDGVPPRAARTAKPPIKKDALFDALRIKGLTTAELVALVRERGVDFELTDEDERELRAAGARPALIEAVRDNYRGPRPGESAAVSVTAVELSFWDSIKNSSDPEDFREYLRKFPDGQFASLATRRVASLTAPAAETRPAPRPAPTSAPTSAPTPLPTPAPSPTAGGLVRAEFTDSSGLSNHVYLSDYGGERAFFIPVNHVHEDASNVDVGRGVLIFGRRTVVYAPDGSDARCRDQGHAFNLTRGQIADIKLHKIHSNHGIRMKPARVTEQDFAFACFGEGEGRACGAPSNDLRSFMTLVFTDFDVALERFGSHTGAHRTK